MSLLLPLRQGCSGCGASFSVRDIELKSNIQGKWMLNQENLSTSIAPRDFQPAKHNPHGSLTDECSICLEILENPLQTKCRHLFCEDCICSLLAHRNQSMWKCPQCRQPLTRTDLFVPKAPKEKHSISAAACSGKAETKDSEVDSNSDVITMNAKLNALLRELEAMREKDPTSKAIIFTQFNDSLGQLCQSFNQRKFKYCMISGSMTIKNRKAMLETFQEDPDTFVFILSMRTGSVGITLTAASHVFILEPCLNPALERQAICRVYRMGQRRPVTVKYMVMKGSIEEKIQTINERQNKPLLEAWSKGKQLDSDGSSSSSSSSSNARLQKNDSVALSVEDMMSLFS